MIVSPTPPSQLPNLVIERQRMNIPRNNGLLEFTFLQTPRSGQPYHIGIKRILSRRTFLILPFAAIDPSIRCCVPTHRSGHSCNAQQFPRSTTAVRDEDEAIRSMSAYLLEPNFSNFGTQSMHQSFSTSGKVNSRK